MGVLNSSAGLSPPEGAKTKERLDGEDENFPNL